MYYPAATHLHYLEAQGILELHRMQWLMEKGQHVHACDPYEPIRRLAMVENASRNPKKQLTSFRINDILDQKGQRGKVTTNACSKVVEHEHNHNKRNDEPLEDSDFSESSGECSSWNNHDASHKIDSVLSSHKIIRPWSTSPLSSESDDVKINTVRHKFQDTSRKLNHSGAKRSRLQSDVSSDEEEIDVEGCDDKTVDSRTDSICTRGLHNSDLSPLGALVAMSSKTFIGLESFESQRSREQEKHKSQSPKKKRKTRTAFTNQQIYELERRFILQKYLTPADRDEIAGRLGLTCAQVITWFQNRRAKFKRDIEEMKNDVVATSPKDPNIGKHE